MNTKLTLRLDDGLIRNAKRHSSKSGKSSSKLTPRVRSLIGSLKGASVTERTLPRNFSL